MMIERYQPILTSIWQDEKFVLWSDDKKLLWFYILTCPHSNMLGLYVLPRGYILEDLKWNFKRLSKPFAELLQEPVIDYDETAKTILVFNKLKHNGIDNENQAKAAAKVIGELPKTFLFSKFSEILEPFAKPYHKPLLERLRERIPESEAVSRKPLAVDKNILSEPQTGSDGVIGVESIIYEKLMEKVTKHRPNHKIGQRSKDEKIIKLMLERDKRKPEQVFSLLAWYPIGEPYIPEIFSASSLREKYEKLESAYNRANPQQPAKHKTEEKCAQHFKAGKCDLSNECVDRWFCDCLLNQKK